ncbi:hypothetical protein TNCV_2565611 [Trichonephila clavipes]|uniref:Uncharacterized protein n=1 Tax=Trichonephila clavipes TaxID=2585209 RepID=A0A8X6SPA4_TRICX|nr:hypothetical protein TNCV_2565611 [Trichonephila clavipes]
MWNSALSVLKPTVKYPTKVMVWGCMSSHGVGRLHIVSGTQFDGGLLKLGDLQENQLKTVLNTCNEENNVCIEPGSISPGLHKIERKLYSATKRIFCERVSTKICQAKCREPIREQHRNETVKHSQKQIFWGYFTSGEPGRKVPVEEMMNIKKDTSIIEFKIVPMMQKFAGSVGIFQQDLVLCHISTLTTIFFSK